MANFSVFDYCYCDASNYKAWGILLLQGLASEADIEDLSNHLDSGEFFIAEQLGIPPLYAELWELSSGPSDDDHVWHTFHELRPATAEEMTGSIWGMAEDLIARIKAVKNWDEALSPQWAI